MKTMTKIIETNEVLRRTVVETLQAIFADSEFGASLRAGTSRRLANFRRKPRGSRHTLDEVIKRRASR